MNPALVPPICEHPPATRQSNCPPVPLVHKIIRFAGRRSLAAQEQFMVPLKAYFGDHLLRASTHGAIEQYKAQRLAVPRMTKYKDDAGAWLRLGRSLS